METLFKILVAPLIFALSMAGYQFNTLGAAQNPVGGERYYLSGSGISSSATTVGLTKFGYMQPNGTYSKFSMTNFGALGCATVQPGNVSGKQEFISFTGLTQNSDGTATLSGVTRGLERYSPFQASTTLQTSHAGGSEVVISNSPPCFYENYASLSQDEPVTGLWSFNSYLPTTSIVATSSNQFTNKSYVDATANAGAATSTKTNGGIVELATGAEAATGAALVVDDPLVIDTSIARSYRATGDSNRAIISDSNGYLDLSFLGLATSSNLIFSGLNNYTASSSFSATTTIAANSTTTRALILNSIAYQFPSIQGASSTSLVTDGAGSLTWDYQSRLLGQATVDATNSTTASSTIASVTVPAGALKAGTMIEGRLNFSAFGLDNTKWFYLEMLYDDTVIGIFEHTATADVGQASGWGEIDFQFYGVTDSTQEGSFEGQFEAGTQDPKVTKYGTSAEATDTAKTLSFRIRYPSIVTYGGATVANSYFIFHK